MDKTQTFTSRRIGCPHCKTCITRAGVTLASFGADLLAGGCTAITCHLEVKYWLLTFFSMPFGRGGKHNLFFVFFTF